MKCFEKQGRCAAALLLGSIIARQDPEKKSAFFPLFWKFQVFFLRKGYYIIE